MFSQYGGNDEAAQKFKVANDIPVYKWDVASYEACAAGLKQIEADLGPVEVLVNNAGITRNSMFHRMTPEQWSVVITTNLNSLFNMCRPVIEGMSQPQVWSNYQYILDQRSEGTGRAVELFRRQGRRLGFTKALSQESARSGITVNAICPGYIATDMVKAMPKDVLEKNILPQFQSAGWASPRRSRAASCSSLPTRPALITGSTSHRQWRAVLRLTRKFGSPACDTR